MELANKEQNYAVVASLAAEIARVAFPGTDNPCGGNVAAQPLAFWWNAKVDHRCVHTAGAAATAEPFFVRAQRVKKIEISR